MDLLVVGIYLTIVFILAFFSRREDLDHTRTDDEIVTDQYLAGRSLSLLESMGSIIATEVSALTFLGIPAFAFSKDFSFIHIYMGALLGRFLIAKYIVPLIYGKKITLYGIMAREDGTDMGARLTALIYSVSKVLAVGVRLYAGSILVAEFFGVNTLLACLLITILTFFYTLIGGLKAVVRTDLLQTALFIAGGVTAHFLIPSISERSWGELMGVASAAGKTSIFDPSHWQVFAVGIIGGVLFDICTHGVDQDFTQRLMGAKSERVAKFSIFFSTFFSIGVGLLFLSIGSLLWAHYQIVPLPSGVKSDEIFAYFITEHFPVGLKGLMLAGVLAATMSTLDSTINALSSVLWSEIWPHRNIHKIKQYLKVDTFIISGLLLLVAVLSSQFQGILELGLKVASWSGGALAALFFSQLVWPSFTKSRLTGPIVAGCYGLNLIGVYTNTFILKWPWQWNVYWGMGLGTLFLLTVSYTKGQKD